MFYHRTCANHYQDQQARRLLHSRLASHAQALRLIKGKAVVRLLDQVGFHQIHTAHSNLKACMDNRVINNTITARRLSKFVFNRLSARTQMHLLLRNWLRLHRGIWRILCCAICAIYLSVSPGPGMTWLYLRACYRSERVYTDLRSAECGKWKRFSYRLECAAPGFSLVSVYDKVHWLMFNQTSRAVSDKVSPSDPASRASDNNT